MVATPGGLQPITTEELRKVCGIWIPSEEWWNAELELGWAGSDGSSCSTDTIFGVRIAETSRVYCTLPADVHDFWYRTLRRMRFQLEFSIWESEVLRKRADQQHRQLLYEFSAKAHWTLRTAFRRRADVRYRTLRWAGEKATIPDRGEVFRRP